MPFKIFVATAGTLEYPKWRFVLTIVIARGVRYYVEGILAVFYGELVMGFIKDYGLALLGVVLFVVSYWFNYIFTPASWRQKSRIARRWVLDCWNKGRRLKYDEKLLELIGFYEGNNNQF